MKRSKTKVKKKTSTSSQSKQKSEKNPATPRGSINSSGLEKFIFSLSSASTILLETTATGIFFLTTNGSATAMTFSAGGGSLGERVHMIGLSGTRWAFLSKTAQVT